MGDTVGGASFQAGLTAYALDALAIGVIVTDRNGQRLYANAAAERLLNQPAGALRCCKGGRVAATHHATQSAFADIIATPCVSGICAKAAGRVNGKMDARTDGARGTYIRIPSPDGDGPDLAICVLPVAAATLETKDDAAPWHSVNAMMLVRPIERDCNLEIEARRLLGLTRAEARLASSLASGASLEAAARGQAITLATARSHLKSIFRRTGLSSQVQVVALLRGAQIPVATA